MGGRNRGGGGGGHAHGQPAAEPVPVPAAAAIVPAPAPEPEPEVVLSADEMKRVDELEKIQEERDSLAQAHDEELRALELKYAALYDGVYAKRKAVVTGAVEAPGVPPGGTGGPRGLPSFWLKAMRNHRDITQFIEEADEAALEFLEDITATNLPKLEGFALHFHFRANPYFENAVLSKEYVVPGELPGFVDEDEEGEGEGEGEEGDESAIEGVKKITGTEINWKAGKNLCVKLVSKKVKGPRGKPKKTVQRAEEVPSFFRFFETPDLHIPEEMGAEQAMEIVNQIQTEISVAQAIRDELLPEAVRYFTGEAAEDDEDDEDDDEDEDDEDDEEDDEDEDEAPAHGARGGGRHGGGARGGRGGGGGGARGAPRGRKDEEDEEDDEEDAAAAAALADAFTKKMKVGGGGAGKKGGKKGDEPPPPPGGGAGGAGGGAGGAGGTGGADGPTPECKQQ